MIPPGPMLTLLPGTALALCNGHHLARCAHLQGQTFSTCFGRYKDWLSTAQLLAHHLLLLHPPTCLSQTRSPIPCAAPPVAQSSWCLHLPASLKGSAGSGDGVGAWKEKKKKKTHYLHPVSIPSFADSLPACFSVIIASVPINVGLFYTEAFASHGL